MWKPISEWPTLTELFFGKGVDPATYKGENDTSKHLPMKEKKLNKSTEKAITAKKPVKKKPIKEVQTKAPKIAKKKLTTKKQYMAGELEKTVKELLEEIGRLTKRIEALEKMVKFHDAIRRR